MKRLLLLLTGIGCISNASGQLISFERGIPSSVSANAKGNISLSSDYYKEGEKSLKWDFLSGSQLNIQMDKPLTMNEQVKDKGGIYLWIYNEEVQKDSIRFEFYNAEGKTTHAFHFRLFSKGWRACWIGFSHMREIMATKEVSGVRMIAPDRKGSVYVDRITLPVAKLNARTTPDYQMPANNSLANRDLWHWCLVWIWEQQKYDIPLPDKLNAQQTAQLHLIEKRMDKTFRIDHFKEELVGKAHKLFADAGIRKHKKGFVGAPLVTPDERNKKAGELCETELETMLSGFAVDVLKNKSAESLKKYELVWKYAIDQGFAWGSGMGTNHHYGYRVRNIYVTAWLMRDYIYKFDNCDEILGALSFWAALQETRQPCKWNRDELLDSWHTLLEPKYISAMMMKDDRWKHREMSGLTRWLSTSLRYTPGTIGGIKPDGTTFHHGLFYPAYTSGVLAHIGNYIELTDETYYEPLLEAKKVLKQAFISMRNYSNKYEWGIGISGRHPFGSKMKQDDIDSFGKLALAGDLSDKGDTIDKELAADYLRLNRKGGRMEREIRGMGIEAAKAPEGFFVYNYGAAGIHRRNNWMVTLKGFNSNICSSEIYVRDNRYGRYQSYGSVQVFGGESRKESGYDENGWDWNRLPGATTIHLPWNLLESPGGTFMIRSKEEFAGSSHLGHWNGVFGMKLREADKKNFTPDFVARKSVFCFDNRVICLGSNISNSNASYPTETTLFQSVFSSAHAPLANEEAITKIGYQSEFEAKTDKPVLLRDGYDNYYVIKEGKVNLKVSKQESLHEKKKTPTTGKFSTAWIDHGKAPRDASYEYMMVIQPDKKAMKALAKADSYTVIRKNRVAHIVKDEPTKTIGYVVFESFDTKEDKLISHIDAETLCMVRESKGNLVMSVCDPNLNIKEKTYTTSEASKPLMKHVIINGDWNLAETNEKVALKKHDGLTSLTVTCQHGIPVEFKLTRK